MESMFFKEIKWVDDSALSNDGSYSVPLPSGLCLLCRYEVERIDMTLILSRNDLHLLSSQRLLGRHLPFFSCCPLERYGKVLF